MMATSKDSYFQSLYEENREKAARHCAYICSAWGQDMAKSVESLGWLYVYNNLEKYNDTYAFMTWANGHFKNARQQVISEETSWSNKKDQYRVFTEKLITDDDDDDSATGDLSKWFEGLSDKEQQILQLRYGNNMCLADISEEMNLSYKYTSTLHSKALKKLRSLHKKAP